jgi:hypothetical protein
LSGPESHDPGKKVPYEEEAILIRGRVDELERQQAEDKKKDDEYKQRQLSFNRLLVGLTFALVIASVFADGISIWQASIANRASEAATSAANTAYETLHIAYRPRITVLGISQEHTLDNGRIHVTFTAPNYGPAPARNVRMFRFDNVSGWNQTVSLPYGDELPDEPRVILPKGNGGDGYGVNGKRIISSEELEGLKAGTLVGTFSILIEYEGDFSIVHHAETCTLFTLQPYNTVCPWPVRND